MPATGPPAIGGLWGLSGVLFVFYHNIKNVATIYWRYCKFLLMHNVIIAQGGNCFSCIFGYDAASGSFPDPPFWGPRAGKPGRRWRVFLAGCLFKDALKISNAFPLISV
jgi:hypothetical protein